jgi:lysophospholipase L1-like esterase
MAKPAANQLTGPVFAVGDSVLLGAKPCFKGTDVRVNAAENRTMAEGADIIEQKAAAGELPPRVVVALGTNSPFGFKVLDRIMNAAGPERAVYFLTVELPDSYSYEGDVNQRLRAMPGRWPNAHVVDWNASVLTEGLYPDGIHLNPQGCQAYANLVLQGVQRS